MKKSWIHCLQNGSFVTISCYIFELVLMLTKFFCKNGYLIFNSWIGFKLLGTILSCCRCLGRGFKIVLAECGITPKIKAGCGIMKFLRWDVG